MKLRTVEKTYDSINDARLAYCDKITECGFCQLFSGNNKLGLICEEFCEKEPEEAAKIMGLEVIDEGDDKMETKKSYLAEILGLEEDEVFRIEGSRLDYRISGGHRERWNEYARRWELSGDEFGLTKLINNQVSIIKVNKTNRLTEQEKKICDDCGAKWVSMDERVGCTANHVSLWREKPEKEHKINGFEYVPSDGDHSIAAFYKDLFPSVKPGDCIEVR